MERWIAKVVALFATFAVIFICMSLPTKVADFIHRRKEKSILWMGILRCFGGGVFLGTILFHMLPEVKDMIAESILEPYHVSYPVAEAIIAGGFFMICFFEKVVMTIHRQRKRRSTAKKLKRNESESCVIPAVVLIGHYKGENDGTPNVMSEVVDDIEGDLDEIAKKANNVELDTKEDGKPEDSEPAGAAHARSIILLMALSFECIFDGLSVGLQATSNGVWSIFIAVISHESIVSFCLGLEILKFHSKKRVILAAFCYATIPPIGNVIGIAITETSSSTSEGLVTMVNGILLGVACGIFLYCTFIGMMGEELIEHSTFKKILATMVGCAVMASLAAVPESEEPPIIEKVTSYSQ